MAIYNRLAAANPARYEPDLATSYGALGTILLKSDKREEAVVAFSTGSNLIRPYAEPNPESPNARLLQHLLANIKRARTEASE